MSTAINFIKNYNNYSITENGALGYKTTLHALLDMNFALSSFRNKHDADILNAYINAYYENKAYAIKWLFFCRDILEGLGERRLFRVCMRFLAKAEPQITRELIPLIPTYGRYDDLLALIDTPVHDDVCKFIKKQLKKDLKAMSVGKEISLLAKWLPSANTSSKQTREYAHIILKSMKMSQRQYRKMLSKLRAYSNVVETKMSANKWTEIDYAKVPAKANMRYDRAFITHDLEGRKNYYQSVIEGNEKLNSNGITPCDIVHRLLAKSGYYCDSVKIDIISELMWQKIVENGFENDWNLDDCIVVCDGSGSMYSYVTGESSLMAIEVASSLAIYFASQLKGAFKDKTITFSENPQLVDLSQGKYLYEKLNIMLAHNEVANTNIERVFELILDMAVSNQVKEEDMPKQLLIISDMEFDMATEMDSRIRREMFRNSLQENYTFDAEEVLKKNDRLFDHIDHEFKEKGYKMPRLIFWNVCGRTDTIPMVDNENGLCLLSGFSQNAIKIATDSNEVDPYQALLRVLDSPRYEAIDKITKQLAS